MSGVHAGRQNRDSEISRRDAEIAELVDDSAGGGLYWLAVAMDHDVWIQRRLEGGVEAGDVGEGIAVDAFRVAGDAGFQRAVEVDFEELWNARPGLVAIGAAVGGGVEDHWNSLAGEQLAQGDKLMVEAVALGFVVGGMLGEDGAEDVRFEHSGDDASFGKQGSYGADKR